MFDIAVEQIVKVKPPKTAVVAENTSTTVSKYRRTKNLNSKHRKRVPTSVNPRCDADAPDGDFACWEVSQTLFCGGLHPLKIFKNIWQKCGRTRSRPCSQKMQLMTLPQRKEVFHYGKFTGHRKGLSRRA